jgi:hypothetical protein
MCAACALVAASAASGARAGLQAYGPRYLTPKRLRMATVAAFAAAFFGASVTFSGTAPPSQAQHAAPAAQR